MFDNMGRKIKILAMGICWVGIISSLVVGVILFLGHETLTVPGIIVMVVGPISSWVGSFVLYGFGQLVENSDILVAQGAARNAEKDENDTQILDLIHALDD